MKKRLEEALHKAFKSPDVQTLLKERLHMPPVFQDSEQLTKRLIASYEAYKKLLKK